MQPQPLLLLETSQAPLSRPPAPCGDVGFSVRLEPAENPAELGASLETSGGVWAIRVAAGDSQDLADSSPQVRARSRERVCEVLDLAARHECRRVVLEPTRCDAPGGSAPYALALAWISESAAELAFEADARSVDLLFDIGPAGLPASPMDAGELIERSESPWLGLALDLGRAQRRSDAASWIEWLAGSARYLRLTDVDYGGSRVGPPSDLRGAVDWQRVAQALREHQFDGELAVSPEARACAPVALMVDTLRELRMARTAREGARDL